MRSVAMLGLVVGALGCGGGGGGAGPDANLAGSLSVVAAAPHSLVADREPNDTAATARLATSDPEGTLDAARDRVDVFRYVAGAAGPLTAELDAGFSGTALLHDLARGAVAQSLDLQAGASFDVVVVARFGAGPYRVRLRGARGDQTPRDLPAGYLACGDGFAPGELVVALAPGVAAEAVADAAGMQCAGGTPDACLLRGGERSLCGLLAVCARLQAEGFARLAEPNYVRRLAGFPSDEHYGDQWGMEQIRAPAAWEHATAADGVVALVDSGIRPHPELAASLLPGWDFVDGDADPTDEALHFSHGTQVAGVLGAAGDNGVGVAGVLWSVPILPVRAFDASGFGTVFTIAHAIRFAAGLENDSGTVPERAAKVLNLSFASGTPTQIEEEACDAARAAGVFLLAASGNQASTSVRYPAGYASVVAVGATARDGSVADYSNRGPWIAIAGPGGTSEEGVRTTGRNSQGEFTYPFVSGTSYAVPHVAGVAMLVCALRPGSTPDEIEAILVESAQDIGEAGRDDGSGAGLVDAHAAALRALEAARPLVIPFEIVSVRLLRLPLRDVAMAAVTSDLAGFSWSLEGVRPGQYVLEAGTDRNFDGVLSGPGELYGQWNDGEPLVVTAGQNRPDLDFAIAPR